MPAFLDRDSLPLLSGGDRTLGTKGATAGLVPGSSLALEYGISQWLSDASPRSRSGETEDSGDDGLAVGLSEVHTEEHED